MKEINPCPLCKTKCEIYSITPLNQLFTIDCPSCGKYNLTDIAIHVLDKRKDSFHIISGITRNFYELHKDTDGFFVIKGEMIDDDAKFQAEFISKAPKSVPEKALLLLQYICRKSNYPGDKVLVNPSQDYPMCFCKNAKELIFYINHIRDSGDIKADGTMRDYTLSLTIKGWQKVECLNRPNIESKQAFVAMWFDEELKSAYSEGIAKLEEDTGFSMFRIDMREFNDKICDKILAEIRRSRFVIADVTGHRQGVYFESGFAMGLGLPVIWTCREDEIDACHFDTRQYNHITWKDADELHQKLKDRILATIGKALR